MRDNFTCTQCGLQGVAVLNKDNEIYILCTERCFYCDALSITTHIFQGKRVRLCGLHTSKMADIMQTRGVEVVKINEQKGGIYE